MTEGQPTFKGSEEEQQIARLMFELMIAQGWAFAASAPIKQSRQNLVSHFVQQKVRPDAAAMTDLLEAAVRQNSHVFHREEEGGQVFYLTTKLGRYVRPPAAVAPHRPPLVVGPARPPVTPVTPTKSTTKPAIARRESVILMEAKPPKRGISREIPPKAIRRHPQIVTPEVVIDLTEEAASIYEKHRGMFQAALRERLAADSRFISFGPDWYLADGLLSFSKSELRQVRDFLHGSGVPESDARLAKEAFGRSEGDADYELVRFSLNCELVREKRDFEFVGTGEDRLWRPTGLPARRTGLLKPGEVGQDMKYLEDEPPASVLEGEAWVHTLTFYEIENGLLPYDPWAKLLLPRPFLKDQKGVWLEFAASQLDLVLFAELHYPGGNRGGWIDGLEELLINFVAGAKLIIKRGERSNALVVEYPLADEPQELSLLRYDERRQRFVFEALPIAFVVDGAQILEKTRFKGLNNVRRLDENSRRKSPSVLAYAFERVGQKVPEDGKTIYRASLDDLLPVVNIEKPFSKASLVKFMSTNPQYRKDTSEEGYYLYAPAAGEKS